MNYLKFSQKMADFPLFSTKELRLIFGVDFKKSFLNKLEYWQKKQHLIRLRKSLYVLGELRHAADPLVLASKIYQPSYVSMETALAYYGIIPEAVFTITSVTSRETKVFSNVFGKFTFQKIKKVAFGGYATIQKKEFGISFNLALPEKALADFCYLNRNILDGTRTQFEGYRFSEEFRYNKKNLIKFAESFKNKKVLNLINNFIEFYVTR